MRIWITYILSLYTLFCILVPCTAIDNCEDEPKKEQTSKREEEKDCNNCPPFSICSACHSFTHNTAIAAIEPPVLNDTPTYIDYNVSFDPEYYASLFQPPQLG